MPKEEQTGPKEVRILFPDASEERPLYANLLNVNHTPWDLTLHFAHVVLPNPSPLLDQEDSMAVKGKSVAVISIPPSLTRSLIAALQTTLESYERLYGKVEIPREAEKKP